MRISERNIEIKLKRVKKRKSKQINRVMYKKVIRKSRKTKKEPEEIWADLREKSKIIYEAEKFKSDRIKRKRREEKKEKEKKT